MSIVSLLGARGQRSTNARREVAFTFDQTVASFDPSVVSYWKFQNTGTDEKGAANATLNGAPELNIPTIVKSDNIATGALIDGTCVAWSNLAGDYAQAAHNAAHKTASGTIVVYFQRDAALAKSQLIDADSASAVGGMQMGINSSGAPDAYIRDGFGTPIPLIGAVNAVVLDRAYALILKWGAPAGIALVLWDDTGAQVSRITNPSTIGLSGISTIRFGATHTNVNHHDGPYGRVIWMNRRITIDEEVVLARATSIARSVDLYRTLELGMGPISLWGMGELGGFDIVDSAGPRTGAFSGTVQYNAMDLPDDSINGAINFAGTGAGTVSHTAALDLAAFTLSFWFRANTIPGPSEAALALITKNTPAPESAGDFLVYIPSNDARFLKVRFRSAPSPAVPLDIDTLEDSILAGNTYHVCVRADNTGFDLFLNGTYHGKNTGYLGAWTVNTAALQFADSPTFTAVAGDTALDEIALFDRILTTPEVLQLAQQTGAPVASDDAAAVPEGQTTAIQVLANDIYVGTPTIAIMAEPTPDDAQVVPAVGATPAFINYVAGGVAVDTVRSFQYRITDPNGISNTATVTVTVIADTTVTISNANCYTHSTSGTGTTINVNNMTALEDAINTANPGSQIIIADGTYAGGTLNLNPQGTTANPIVVRPEDQPPNHGRGSVVINNAIWNLNIASARLVITNLFFNNPLIRIRGSHHRISRCQFRQINTACDVFEATDLRIDHCDAAGMIGGVDNLFVHTRPAQVGNGTLKRFLFDYNYCHDMAPTVSGVSEVIGVPSGGGGADFTAPGYVVDHNLWLRLRVSRIIGTKGSGWVISYNTFEDTPFQYCPRNGEGFEVRSNWIENNVNAIFLRAQSDGLLVIGNRFVGPEAMTVGPGHYYWVTGQSGVGNGNPAARDARIIGNWMETGFIRVGADYNAPEPYTQPALRTNIVIGTGPRANRKVDANGAFLPGNPVPYQITPPNNNIEPGDTLPRNPNPEDNTTFNDDTGPGSTFTPAVKLLPADVGMGAADPLCTGPGMPQN